MGEKMMRSELFKKVDETTIEYFLTSLNESLKLCVNAFETAEWDKHKMKAEKQKWTDILANMSTQIQNTPRQTKEKWTENIPLSGLQNQVNASSETENPLYFCKTVDPRD